MVATYEIQRIIYFTTGVCDTADTACFAFTWSHGDSHETTIFQCHVFRCQIPEAVTQVNNCFSKAFSRIPTAGSLSASVTSATGDNPMLASVTSDVTGNPLSQAMYEFNVSVEIRERVSKTAPYLAVARDKNVFKLRCNCDKEVCILVKQIAMPNLPPLLIERCFGVLLSPGKLVRQADMQLLDMVNMGFLRANDTHLQGPQLLPYQIKAEWKANDKAFEQLNAESPKKYVTVAIDLVIKGIQEPVRFVIEMLVTILSQNESRLMDNLLLSKRPLLQKFYLQLKDNAGSWEVQSIDPSEEIVDQQPASLRNFTRSLSKVTGQMIGRSQSMIEDFDEFSEEEGSPDTDEPLLSGTGEVSRDCSADCIEQWSSMFAEWETAKRPKTLPALVRLGIPEALRGKVWQKLANVEVSLLGIKKNNLNLYI